ncbi:hypothetical protein DH2020_021295 [Rehmannia glutinosa]|uniref:Reverse transcriptase zinc-binding domain-containing protein n=1 Tax=Rehmannia glutinosa TaxID=99300 RepID=A0ABR0WE85_REHGL
MAWDRDTVHHLFSQSEARSIISIPLSMNRKEDKLTWHFTKDGRYSVKSGYKVAKTLKENELRSPASSGNKTGLWKWLWALSIPNKVKIFLWRCLYGILPTKGALIRKGVSIEGVCTRCGMMVESNEHAVRDCMWMEHYWVVSPLRFRLPEISQRGTLGDWIVFMKEHGDKEGHALFAMLMWGAWCSRNDVTFGKNTHDQSHYIQMAINRLHEHAAALSNRTKTLRDEKLDRWMPPDAGYIKVNTDAYIREGEGSWIGVAIRDERGQIVTTLSRLISTEFDVAIAEAIACRDGRHWN